MNRNFERVAENVKINLNEPKNCENYPNILKITEFWKCDQNFWKFANFENAITILKIIKFWNYARKILNILQLCECAQDILKILPKYF
jgi:hypothetical protein